MRPDLDLTTDSFRCDKFWLGLQEMAVIKLATELLPFSRKIMWGNESTSPCWCAILISIVCQVLHHSSICFGQKEITIGLKLILHRNWLHRHTSLIRGEDNALGVRAKPWMIHTPTSFTFQNLVQACSIWMYITHCKTVCTVYMHSCSILVSLHCLHLHWHQISDLVLNLFYIAIWPPDFLVFCLNYTSPICNNLHACFFLLNTNLSACCVACFTPQA